jgi:hypothetical protein
MTTTRAVYAERLGQDPRRVIALSLGAAFERIDSGTVAGIDVDLAAKLVTVQLIDTGSFSHFWMLSAG